tara:strand:- start:1476 stop:2351 length:876 start_codon:yes stop_codon:yes gene_type:complete
LIGIIAAFGASLSWTYACSIWRLQTIVYKPIEINIVKNLLAFLVFIPTIIFCDYSTEYKYFFLLILSGIIGIGLGDTFYLKSLKSIGTRKTLSIEALSPLIAAFTGEFFISETLSINSWLGIIIVSATLIIIIRKKSFLLTKNSKYDMADISFNNFIYSFLSVFCAVIAALLSRIVLLESNLIPIQTAEIRLFGAILFLLPISKLKIIFFIKDLETKEKVRFIISVLMGTNIGIFLQQIVFQTLPLGIGWALLSTSPIISLFFAQREEGALTKDIIILTILLFIGLCLIFL